MKIKILEEFDRFEWQVKIQKTYTLGIKGKCHMPIFRIKYTGTWQEEARGK